MFEKMESKDETTRHSLTSLGGGDNLTIQCPKKKARK
jgi:hypothetical protein